MAVLEEVTQAVRSVSERVGPAVVGLGRGWGRGSGVVIADGAVLTTAHNLRGDQVTVVFAGGRRETGTVAGVDADGDVAVVSVDTGEIEAVEWGDPDALSAGAGALALANRGGAGGRGARDSRRARAGDHARPRHLDRQQPARPARPTDPRRDRAHGPAAPGLE